MASPYTRSHAARNAKNKAIVTSPSSNIGGIQTIRFITYSPSAEFVPAKCAGTAADKLLVLPAVLFSKQPIVNNEQHPRTSAEAQSHQNREESGHILPTDH